MTTKITVDPRFELPDSALEATFRGWSSGAYDLPPGLVACANAWRVLTAAAAIAKADLDRNRAVNEQALRLGTVNAIIATAIDSGTIPADPARPLVEARQATADAGLRYELLNDAAGRCHVRLMDALVPTLEAETVGSYLRPAFAAVLDDVRAVVPALRGIDLAAPPEGLAASDTVGQTAFLTLSRARVRLDAILAARDELGVRVDAQSYVQSADARSWFRDVASAPVGPPTGTLGAAFRPAGPVDGLSRLVWLAADPDAEPALLTAAERRERVETWARRPMRPAGRVATIHG